MNLAIHLQQKDELERQQAAALGSTSYPAIDEVLIRCLLNDEHTAAAVLYGTLKHWLREIDKLTEIIRPVQKNLQSGLVELGGRDGDKLQVALNKAYDMHGALAQLIVESSKLIQAAKAAPNDITSPPEGYAAPTPEQLESIEFKEVWAVMKEWDINVPGWYEGYTGCQGNHVMAVLNAMPVVKSDESGHEYKVPASMAAEFDRIMDGINVTKSYTEEWYELCEQINDKFGDYRI